MGFELDHLVHHVEKPIDALKVFNKFGLHTDVGEVMKIGEPITPLLILD